MYSRKQKSGAFLICMILIAMTFFSLLFLVEHSNHKCAGEDCSVCASLHQVKQTLRQTGDGAVRIAEPFFLLTTILAVSGIGLLFLPRTSLVSQKVRMDN